MRKKINMKNLIKKSALFTFTYFLFFILSLENHAFLWEDLWVDLYKVIDSGIWELELKLTETEIRSENINKDLKKLWQDCLESVNAKELKEISSWNIELASQKIDDICKKDWIVWIKDLLSVQSDTRELNNIYTDEIEDKTKQIHSIARIWLYIDWIEENSWFDLITDLQEIDKIIFSEEIEYNWEELTNDKGFDNLIEDLNKKDENTQKWKKEESSENNDEVKLWEKDETIDSGIYSWSNNYVCKDQNDSSWLSEETLEEILKWSNKWKWSDKNIIWEDNRKDGLDKISKKRVSFNKRPRTWYVKINDNSVWPCSEFFCILIEFITYNYNLLWWGKTFSIESVVNRSNWHLKKFANMSLAQSKMTTNNFELWLRDLNLPEMFHLWFQVSKKSPPILNLQQEENWEGIDKKDEWPLTSKNMLREYYKNLWLDYDRANSLVKYKHKEEELKTIIDSAEMSIEEVTHKYRELQKNYDTMLKRNDLVSIQVDKSILYEDINDFYRQFVELEKFASGLNDYSSNINWIIKEFSKTPIHK